MIAARLGIARALVQEDPDNAKISKSLDSSLAIRVNENVRNTVLPVLVNGSSSPNVKLLFSSLLKWSPKEQSLGFFFILGTILYIYDSSSLHKPLD